MKSRNGTISSSTFFYRNDDFSVQGLDFFFVAQGFGLDVKGKKRILPVVFCPDCELS